MLTWIRGMGEGAILQLRNTYLKLREVIHLLQILTLTHIIDLRNIKHQHFIYSVIESYPKIVRLLRQERQTPELATNRAAPLRTANGHD